MLCFMLAWLVLWWLSFIFWYIAHTSSTDTRFSVLFWNGRWRPSIGSNGADSIKMSVEERDLSMGSCPGPGVHHSIQSWKNVDNPLGFWKWLIKPFPLWVQNQPRNAYRNHIGESQNIFIAGIIQLKNTAGNCGPVIGLLHLPVTPCSKIRCWDGPLVEQTLSWSTTNGTTVSHLKLL